MNYETSHEIEWAVAGFFGVRTHIIVPNISWGMLLHECDLAVLSPTGYLWEVEIKTSKADLVRDKSKRKWLFYKERKIRKLWFAIPKKLLNAIEHIPTFAGVLTVSEYGLVHEIRKPEVNDLALKLTEAQKFQLARLGTMRIWKLKRKLIEREKK